MGGKCGEAVGSPPSGRKRGRTLTEGKNEPCGAIGRIDVDQGGRETRRIQASSAIRCVRRNKKMRKRRPPASRTDAITRTSPTNKKGKGLLRRGRSSRSSISMGGEKLDLEISSESAWLEGMAREEERTRRRALEETKSAITSPKERDENHERWKMNGVIMGVEISETESNSRNKSGKNV